MKSYYTAKLNKLFDIFFGDNPNQGDTPAKLRQAIEAYAYGLSNTRSKTPTLPTELEAYVRKITFYAHQVTDDDIAELKAMGYSEDELFEITISAALGAGRCRLECGLAALNGDG